MKCEKFEIRKVIVPLFENSIMRPVSCVVSPCYIGQEIYFVNFSCKYLSIFTKIYLYKLDFS